MAKTYDLNDNSVVVVIGSGAGGGTRHGAGTVGRPQRRNK